MLRSFTISSTRGFTLIEVISVVVILSILAVLGAQVAVKSTEAYRTTQTRARLVNTGRQAIERMSRQLRGALPYSIRVTNDNLCLEFMPIAGGGNYYDPVPDATNGIAPRTSLAVSSHNVDFGTAEFLSIGAMAADEIYGNAPGSRATLTARTEVLLNFSPPMGWARNSINKRFYLLTRPQAFCVVANQLRFYAGQNVTAAGVDTSGASSLLADNVTGTTAPFVLANGSENNNMLVRINITFMQGLSIATGAEAVAFNHAVMIRNVP